MKPAIESAADTASEGTPAKTGRRFRFGLLKLSKLVPLGIGEAGVVRHRRGIRSRPFRPGSIRVLGPCRVGEESPSGHAQCGDRPQQEPSHLCPPVLSLGPAAASEG